MITECVQMRNYISIFEQFMENRIQECKNIQAQNNLLVEENTKLKKEIEELKNKKKS